MIFSSPFKQIKTLTGSKGQVILSGWSRRDPPPQTSTQTVFDPTLLPLLHGVGFVGRTEHGHTATPKHTHTRTHSLL